MMIPPLSSPRSLKSWTAFFWPGPFVFGSAVAAGILLLQWIEHGGLFPESAIWKSHSMSALLAFGMSSIFYLILKLNLQDKERLQTLFYGLTASFPDLLFVIDEEGWYHAAFSGEEDLLYRESAKLVGKRMQDVLPPEAAELYLSTIRKALDSRKTQTLEYCLNVPAGVRWFEGRVTPLEQPFGGKRACLWISREQTKRKEMEDRLAQGELKLRRLFEGVRDGIVLLNDAGQVVAANPVASSLLGVSADDILNFSALRFPLAHGWDPRRVWAELVEKKEIARRLWIRRPDGGERLMDLSVKSDPGAGLHSIVFRDATESARAEQNLREMEEMYRQILDAIPDLVLVKGPRSRIRWANRAFRDYYGMTNEQLRDIIDAPFNEPDYTQKYIQDDARVFETGRTLDIPEEPVTRHDGAVRLFHTVKSAILDTAGKVLMTVGVSRDITERRQAEKEIRNLTRAIEQSPSSILITDPEGKIEYVNPKFCETTGYAAEEALGQTPRILKSGLTEPEVYEGLWRTIKAGKEWQGELINRRRSGELIYEHVLISPVLDDKGKIAQFLAIQNDVTAQKQSENEKKLLSERLAQSEKMSAVGQLAAGIAHEINNPLGVILGFSQALLRGTPDSSPAAHPLTSIEREAQRCRRLVQDLLVFSRKDGSSLPETCPLNSLVADVLSLIRAQAKMHGVEVVLALCEEDPPVLVHRNLIQQVLINLCNNALDAMPRSGTLTLQTQASGEGVEIAVSDTGTGMSADVQKRIFEPFYTTKEVGRGTGLGLTLVYEIVRRHSGRIEVESAPGKGTRMRVFLRAAA